MTAHFRKQPLYPPTPPPPPIYIWLIIPFAIILGAAILTLVFTRQPMSATTRRRLAKGMRWAARIIGLAGTAFYLLCWFAAWSFSDSLILSSAGVIFSSATLVIALAGCIISWWRLRLAGVLLIATSLGLVFNPLFIRLSWTGYYYIRDYLMFGSPLLIAGVLFLLSWWLSRKTSSPAPPLSPKS